MAKIVRLTENDLVRIVKKIISEEMAPPSPTTNTPPPAPTTTSQYGYQTEILPELKNNIFKFKKGASSIDANSITNWREFEKFRNTIVNYVSKNKKNS